MFLLLLAVTGGNLILGFGIAVAMGHGPKIDWEKIKPHASVTGVFALLRGKNLSAPAADSHGHDAHAAASAHGDHGDKPSHGSHGH